MENQQEEIIDSLEGRRVHLCLVSKQNAANLGPIERYQPSEVVLFVTEKMKDTAISLEESIKMSSRGVKISKVDIPSANDMANCIEVISKVLDKYGVNDVAVNVTGGTKIMSMAASVAACMAGAKAFYLEITENKTSLIDIFSGSNAMESHVLDHKLKIKPLLASYGFKVVGSKAMGSLSLNESDVVKWILKTHSMKDAIPRLNELAVGAEKLNPMVVAVPPMPGDLKVKFDTLCDEFAKINRLQVVGRKIKFASEADRFFVAGGWLECLVFNELSFMNLSPMGNLIVMKDGKNEIDAAFVYKGALHIVECKTCNMSETKFANPVIDKLNNLKEIGGEKTKLLLVSFQELHPASMNKAIGKDIEVVTGRQILRLQEIVKAWLK